MSHKCPHCQKSIAVKMILDIVTEEQFVDEYLEKKNKKKKESKGDNDGVM